MEFLIGRSLCNNILNLRLDPIARRFLDEKQIDGLSILEEEPDAGLGNGGLGRLAACFLDSMATMQLPAMGYGLRYEYGIFKQIDRGRLAARAARQLAAVPGSLGSPATAGIGRDQARLLVRGAGRRSAGDTRPSVEPARHAVRSPGRRLWRQDDQHATAVGRGNPQRFRFPGVQRRRICQRAGEAACRGIGDPRPLPRQLDQHGAGASVCAGIFSRRLLAR